MPSWSIPNIAIPIPTLRIGQVRNDRIRLDKVVDIRRTPRFSIKKVVKVQIAKSKPNPMSLTPPKARTYGILTVVIRHRVFG